MIKLGLTGSIGMGKSTTAQFFREAGIPVNDADQVVHELYRGKAVAPIEIAFPGVASNGVVDRQKLADYLSRNPAKFAELEVIVHPLVRAEEQAFLVRQKEAGADLVVLDIPLLFETGGQDRVDSIVVVTCDPDIQEKRVLARPGMTREKFDMILSRQMSDSEKRRRADFIVDTGLGFEPARQAVDNIIQQLRQQKA
ncbi:dephospho-CoA kinase [Agrobacterium sp. ES01]|uniref:dephospho-CoA kinase n=1 Tax=Agrobacterium sp. ES01 TaxID=3420714 RepID=UPI003D13FF4E